MIFFIDTRELLAHYFEDLCACTYKMIQKTGDRGHTGETVINLMLQSIPRGDGCLLIKTDDNDKIRWFVFCVLITGERPWMEVVGMWSVPWILSKEKFEAFKAVKAWGHAHGAVSILAGITRHPETYYRWFHRPLGFKNIGMLIAFDLKGERDGVS